MLASAGNEAFFIQGLLHADVFPHEVTGLRLLETHISWVILTGPFAYKIKKPVQFDFVDYSTLEARKTNCLKEVELNRRFAPNLYLGVVPILSSNGSLQVASGTLEQCDRDSAEPIEYAVKMREFPQDSIVAARLDHQDLTSQVVERFGIQVARFHDGIESAIPTIACVQTNCIEKDALDNFTLLAKAFDNDERLETIERLRLWSSAQFHKLKLKFETRLHNGLVRRCHGDLHLKNIILIDGRLQAFDGIEFNEEFQWIDVLSEIAFPVMDFVARGRRDLGWRLLNAYLESSGEYEALDVLRFYLVYRAMVRAKVTWLNPSNHSRTTRDHEAQTHPGDPLLAGPWDKYLDAASYFAFELAPQLSLMYGFSGSGKSTRAIEVLEQQGGVRIRSDVERNRLSVKFKARDKYSEEMNDWVFEHLLGLAKAALQAGIPVIVDATFLKLKRRTPFQSLADDLKVDFEILACDAPYEELCRRLQNRSHDPSEATIEVLNNQMKTHDPLTTDELQYAWKGEH